MEINTESNTECNDDYVTIPTRPNGIPVTIRADALSALPTAVWAIGRSGTMKALSRDMPQPGGLLLVREHSSAVLIKQVVGTPEEQYDDVTKTVGSFANVRNPSLNAIRKNLPKDAWHISGETPAKPTPSSPTRNQKQGNTATTMTMTNEELGKLVRDYYRNHEQLVEIESNFQLTGEYLFQLGTALRENPRAIRVRKGLNETILEDSQNSNISINAEDIGTDRIIQELTQHQEYLSLEREITERLHTAGMEDPASMLNQQLED